MDAQPAGGIAGTHRWGAFSETGARERNEDRWGVREGGSGLVAWAVADGMGGHDDGDAAAAAGIDAFLDVAAAQDDPETATRRGMAAARAAVGQLRGPDLGSHAPSSTLVGLVLKGRTGFVCHAGDSALFVFRLGRLVHRTRDHNVRELKRSVSGHAVGSASEDPDASKLTRSLGDALPGDATDTVSRLKLRAGDLLLLCSDGVSQHISAEDPGAWAAGAQGEGTLLELARRTVEEAANARQDNYTAVAIHLGNMGVKAIPAPHVVRLAASSLAVTVLIALAWAWGSGRDNDAETLEASASASKPVTEAAPATTPGLAAPMQWEGTSAATSQGERSAGPAIAATTCRTVYVSRQECSTVERKGTRCRSESERQLEWAGDWQADTDAVSGEMAEGLCQSQVHAFVTRRFAEQCRGQLAEVGARCDCDWEAGTDTGSDCAARAHAVCQPLESCEDILVPDRVCRTVREPKEVCEEGTTKEEPR